MVASQTVPNICGTFGISPRLLRYSGHIHTNLSPHPKKNVRGSKTTVAAWKRSMKVLLPRTISVFGRHRSPTTYRTKRPSDPTSNGFRFIGARTSGPTRVLARRLFGSGHWTAAPARNAITKRASSPRR